MKKIALGLLCTVGTFGMSFAKDNKKEDVKQSMAGCTVRVDLRYTNACGGKVSHINNYGERPGTAAECADGGVHIDVVVIKLDIPCGPKPDVLSQSVD